MVITGVFSNGSLKYILMTYSFVFHREDRWMKKWVGRRVLCSVGFDDSIGDISTSFHCFFFQGRPVDEKVGGAKGAVAVC